MLVKELIAELESMPQHVDVILASDEEGNSYFNVYKPQVETNEDGDKIVLIYPCYPEVYLY